MTDATLPSGTAARPAWTRRLTTLDPKYLITFLITLVLVLGEWRYSILGGYERLAITLGTCVGIELLLSRLVRGRFANIQSAYISGISLALLTKPQSGLLWPFALGGVLAITSKYAIQYRGRHLWNPSNFAISLLLLLAPTKVAILSHQWGNELPTNLVIWAFGLAIAWRARVLHVTLTYVVAFLVFAVGRALFVDTPLIAEIAPLTGPMYQLFVFFMITDPRTTVGSRTGRMLVAGSIAAVEMGIRVAADLQWSGLALLYPSPPILALFIVGPIAMGIDLRRERGRGKGEKG